MKGFFGRLFSLKIQFTLRKNNNKKKSCVDTNKKVVFIGPPPSWICTSTIESNFAENISHVFLKWHLNHFITRRKKNDYDILWKKWRHFVIFAETFLTQVQIDRIFSRSLKWMTSTFEYKWMLFEEGKKTFVIDTNESYFIMFSYFKYSPIGHFVKLMQSKWHNGPITFKKRLHCWIDVNHSLTKLIRIIRVIPCVYRKNDRKFHFIFVFVEFQLFDMNLSAFGCFDCF